MKNYFLGALIVGAMCLCSCGSKLSVSKSSEVRYREFTGLVTHMPVTADLDVKSTKVQGVYEERGKVQKNGREKSVVFDVEACKSQAILDALTKTGADILIQPIFTIEQIKTRVTVKVSGYPGFYKNFRPVVKGDKELLEIHPAWWDNKASSSESSVIGK